MGCRSMTCSEIMRATLLACIVAASNSVWSAPGALAQPVQVVNVCGSDDAGGGLNLATALSQGGSIEIRCPAGQTEIQFTQTRSLSAAVSITGEGDVTLRGPASGSMFTTSRSLRLSRLTLVNSAPVTGSIVSGDQSWVSLDSVVVRDSPSAFLVRFLRAEDSHFSNNGDAASEATGSAVINAETVELRRSEFTGNGDHPIAGGAWPAPDRIPLSRRVTIDNTSFAGNPASTILIDAKVSIRASRFVENGRSLITAGGAWGCCGGAITAVRSEVEIFDSDFQANGSSGFGGAIHAISSRLTIGRSTFARNEARVGGAIMSWGRPPLVNIWGADDWTDLPRLVLTRATFERNRAEFLGGAIAFAGPVNGDGLVLTGNQAGTAGGAIASWRAAALPEPYSGVLSALVDNTEAQPSDRIALARSALVENRAGASGAAASFADADAVLGNLIVARNIATTGAALTGTKLRLVNSVVADNAATGIETLPGGALILGNSAILRNIANCALAEPPSIIGPNLQNPGGDCGSQIATADPGLDGSYSPELLSAARDAGGFGLCVSEPTVAGVDIYGTTRIGGDQRCDIGAIERDFFETIASGLTFDTIRGLGQCLMWVLLFLLLLVFITAILIRLLKKKAL